MQRLTAVLRTFVKSDGGVTAIEYALLGGLIAVVIVAAVASTGAGVNSFFTYVSDRVAAATGGL
jgi:pilus assembly protein Flp/PilA